jgi:hypothetical protein
VENKVFSFASPLPADVWVKVSGKSHKRLLASAIPADYLPPIGQMKV